MPIVEFAIRNPVKVTVGVILVCMFGLLALLSIPVQLKPDVSKPVITVETRWPGASPQEIEKEIIDKQEEQLKSIEGMTEFKSESHDGRGRIVMEFAVGTDMTATLLKVDNKLGQVPEYPVDAEEPRIESVDTNQGFIAWIILNARAPTHDELRAFLMEHPELDEPLEPVLAQQRIELRRLIQIGRSHPAMKQLLDQLVDTSLMKRFAEDEIETRLERVPGVSNSNVIGGREEEMRVVVDSAKLAARQITIIDLRNAMAAENKDVSGGDIWDEKSRVVVRTLGQFSEIEHVENVIIARRGGAPVRVKDVARVELGYTKPQSIVRRMGMASIAINVQRDPKANVLEVMAGVKAAIDEMNAEGGILASRGVELTQVYDETIYIKSSTTLVRNNMLLGAVLAVAVLLVFLRSARSTLVVALAIPISVIGTFLIISALGRSINVISLAGMSFAVGMVVDAAIVVLENIYSHYQRGESPMVAAGRGTAEVWGAVLASTLTTLAVFLPVVFVEEQAGQLFRDIAIAISGAVALSLIVSVIVIPVAASRILRERAAHGAGETKAARDGTARLGHWIVDALVRMTDRLQSGRLGRPVVIAMCVLFTLGVIGTALAGWSPAKPVPFVAIAIALVVSAAFVPLAWRLPRAAFAATMISLSIGISLAIMPPAEYLPEGNRNLVMGFVQPPPGYNFDQLEEIGDVIEAEMSPYWEAEPGSPEEAQLNGPAIEHFFFVARGRSIFMGAKAADPSRAAELVPVMGRATAKVPGTSTFPKQASLFDGALSGGRKIQIEITGPEMERLIAVGGQIMGAVSEIYPNATTGTTARPVPSLDLGSPELHIRPNREKASQRGVRGADLGYTVNALVDGAYAGDYWHVGKKIDLVIFGEAELSDRIEDIGQLQIATPSGEMVPLSAVTHIAMSSGPEQINRIDRQRSIMIEVTPGANVPLETAIERIEAEVLGPIRASGQLENGKYHLRLAGTADDLKQMRAALAGSMILAIIITYLLIAALYESFLYPIVIMISVPMAAVGGFLGLRLLNLFVHQPMDTLTMLGFVILIGTVVNNAILIVNQALIYIRRDAMEHRRAVTESVRGRIRPIAMSTATTVFGMLPLVVWPGAGSELYRGLGSVVLGGLVVSTIFTLLLVPMLFSLAFETRQRLAQLVYGTPVAEPIEASMPIIEADAAGNGNGRQGQPGPRSADPIGE